MDSHVLSCVSRLFDPFHDPPIAFRGVFVQRQLDFERPKGSMKSDVGRNATACATGMCCWCAACTRAGRCKI